MAQQQKKPRYTLPRGTMIYPKLITPDTKFKVEGEYSVKVRMAEDAPGVQRIINLIDEGAAASLEAAKENAKTPAEKKKWETKYLPYAYVEDENGDRTGEVEFKATMKASGVSKKTGKPWKMEPRLFDGKGAAITGKKRDSLRIGNGSVGIVSFTIQPYAPTTQIGASVKLALEAVQLISVSQGGGSADDYGFEKQDDGFDSDDIEEMEDDTAADEDSAADVGSKDEDEDF